MQQYFPNLLRLILKCFHWASRQMIKFVICMFIWIFVSRKYILDYKTGISCANKSLKFNIRRKERACTNLPRKIKKKKQKYTAVSQMFLSLFIERDKYWPEINRTFSYVFYDITTAIRLKKKKKFFALHDHTWKHNSEGHNFIKIRKCTRNVRNW